MIIRVIAFIFAAALAASAIEVVQILPETGETIPANSIATPQQVSDAEETASGVLAATTNLSVQAMSCADAVRLYSTNYVVTSTVYVQSIGGVPYDASNQVVRLHSLNVTDTNVQVLVTVKQTPLVTPALDWRTTLGAGGVWSNTMATAQEVSVPAGVTNAATAYLYTLARPSSTSLFLRAVDNSTGASGSGLWWVVFGGITVDGQRGATLIITNVVDSVTNYYNYAGGILTEPTPLGE